MIDLDDVGYRYEDMTMSFTLHVAAGTFAAIIGPSGGGKSTLLSLIAGFARPAAGRVILDNRDMTDASPAARLVSMIFQDHNVFAHLDVKTNVALGISPSLRLTTADRAAIDQALDRVGLAALHRRMPGDVSGGERQRIAIARALVRRKPILLLDEPFAALGPALRLEMLDLLREVQKEQKLTILMVTHQPEDAEHAASHTAFLADGRIAAYLPTAELLSGAGHPDVLNYLGTR